MLGVLCTKGPHFPLDKSLAMALLLCNLIMLGAGYHIVMLSAMHTTGCDTMSAHPSENVRYNVVGL